MKSSVLDKKKQDGPKMLLPALAQVKVNLTYMHAYTAEPIYNDHPLDLRSWLLNTESLKNTLGED